MKKGYTSMFDSWDLSLESHESRDTVREAFHRHFELSESHVEYIINALCALYNGREYHNLNHIAYVLEKASLYFERDGLIDNPEELDIAILFHDCIYTGSSKNDVFASAHLAKCIAKGIGLSTNAIERIGKLILSTHSHIPYNNDSGILCDCDMAILGDWNDYNIYATNVKSEYISLGVSEKAYKIGRIAFLEKTIGKDIFHTERGKSTWEERAKMNMERELLTLKTLDI